MTADDLQIIYRIHSIFSSQGIRLESIENNILYAEIDRNGRSDDVIEQAVKEAKVETMIAYAMIYYQSPEIRIKYKIV